MAAAGAMAAVVAAVAAVAVLVAAVVVVLAVDVAVAVAVVAVALGAAPVVPLEAMGCRKAKTAVAVVAAMETWRTQSSSYCYMPMSSPSS